MKTKIVTVPFKANLVGFSSQVADGCYGLVGRRLMDAMWNEIGNRKLPHHGVNHWVYLPGCVLFSGVELKDGAADIGPLEQLQIELKRHARYVHVGPYSKLPEVWAAVKKDIADAGESIAAPSLEVYGHWCQDESKLETTILISLEPGKIEHKA